MSSFETECGSVVEHSAHVGTETVTLPGVAGQVVAVPLVADLGVGPGRAVLAAPYRRFPSKLFVEVTSRCNLRCRMCVKQAAGQGIEDGSMSAGVFGQLLPAFEHLDALVLNGVGEPLLHPELEEFIAIARDRMPAKGWIGFQTNGQLLTERRAASLVAAGIDRIAISADAVANEQLMSIRDGARIGPIEQAAGWVHAAAERAGRQVSMGLEFVAMRDNVDQLPALVRWAGRHRFDFLIVTHMLPYDEAMAAQAAFSPSTDRAVAIYRQWQDVARTEGLDLRSYADLSYLDRHLDKYTSVLPIEGPGSTPGARVAEYVRQMVADAADQGISLKIADLVAFDEDWLAHVQTVFAQAQHAAEELDIDLRLPATVPTQVRQCHFVEEGSAFVSWKGDLHPCYFLWHGFQCHLAGLAMSVQPVTFGNVRKVPLLDSWNAAEWTEFRRNVLRYDFPFCYDCNLAMCDYVEGGDFEQDCHIATVPCATCLWCTGPFQCMR